MQKTPPFIIPHHDHDHDHNRSRSRNRNRNRNRNRSNNCRRRRRGNRTTYRSWTQQRQFEWLRQVQLLQPP
jgi:hypothetical protein